MENIYLDNNATTKVAPEVLEEMLPCLTGDYGNPSSIHRFGAKAGAKMKEARERVSAFLHCRESELVFTSCGTESNNLAIRGALEATPDKRHIVTTKVEHSSVLNVLHRMEKLGYALTILDVGEDGLLDLDNLRDALTSNTALVSIMHANNETGVLFPMEEIVNITKEHGVPLFVDAIQTVGKIPVDLSKLEIDLLAISGHKFHAPKGIGALYIRKGTRIRPMMLGGPQERNRRAGTENVAFIAGLARACELAEENFMRMETDVRRLRDKLEDGIAAAVPGAKRNGHKEKRLTNTSNFCFPVEGEAVLLMLDELGVYASSGSACASGALEPSHVLRAMNRSEKEALGAVRLTLSRCTTEKEIDFVLEKLPAIIEKLSAITPKVLPDFDLPDTKQAAE
ncbi:MAG: cysteine desulfurase NifS [Candidatus Latescibacteria bacterium]|nr:cysteine desulfurase NifS [Candidatus Latescibacterota bacterium]NIM22712.1 cysteine desulfurase NifS [Candidatus Latescibacterota bacterium]NIM65001.1 cysteine desulfurase NifS [Candidatus Latescibacterota bacterium]NIO01516.1 cysteine desulfurase NifS [Candidatus Latescibacterota bacterium]NIO28025.1 cysteine desulfurase NifS [Candidatus Latescibacterota bacterium]